MNKYIIKIVLILLFFLFSITLFPVPEKNDVEKIVNNEIKKEIDNNKKNQFIGNFFISIFKKIRTASNIIFFFFLIFSIVTIILIITFIIIRNVSSSKYDSQFTNAI